MNALSINIPANFIYVCECELERAANATTPAQLRGVLNGDTVQGIKWAIEFVKGLSTDYMTEKELKHATRLTRFRGYECPKFA